MGLLGSWPGVRHVDSSLKGEATGGEEAGAGQGSLVLDSLPFYSQSQPGQMSRLPYRQAYLELLLGLLGDHEYVENEVMVFGGRHPRSHREPGPPSVDALFCATIAVFIFFLSPEPGILP